MEIEEPRKRNDLTSTKNDGLYVGRGNTLSREGQISKRSVGIGKGE